MGGLSKWIFETQTVDKILKWLLWLKYSHLTTLRVFITRLSSWMSYVDLNVSLSDFG